MIIEKNFEYKITENDGKKTIAITKYLGNEEIVTIPDEIDNIPVTVIDDHSLRNKNISKDILDVYDMQLAEFGYNIIIDRLEYIKKLNKYSEKIHSDITSGKEKIEFKYTSTIKDLENIKESFYSLLEKK